MHCPTRRLTLSASARRVTWKNILGSVQRTSSILTRLAFADYSESIGKMSSMFRTEMSGACHRRLTGVLFPASLRDAEQLRSIRNRPVRNVQPGNSLEFVIVGNDCVW